MTQATLATATLRFLEDRWDPAVAASLDEPELLRYRSNLLGSDLRITNFAGGNTSSKVMETDPLTGEPVEVIWVKGSGGDLGSIKRTGFATLYQEKLLALERSYKGVDTEDDMVAMYPMCAFRNNPGRRVHRHAAARLSSLSARRSPASRLGHRPGCVCQRQNEDGGVQSRVQPLAHLDSVAAPRLRTWPHDARCAVRENPGCDGIVLGGHGLFTWGQTQRECYLNTITIIDQIGQFIARHGETKGTVRFGGEAVPSRNDRHALALEVAPYLRGRVSSQNRWISSFSDAPDVLQFVNSAHAEELAYLGTSCPDHFIRTKIRPMFVPWPKNGSIADLKAQIDRSLDRISRTVLRPTTTTSPRPIRPPCAIPAPPSFSSPASACSASAKTRPKPASSASSTPTPFT